MQTRTRHLVPMAALLAAHLLSACSGSGSGAEVLSLHLASDDACYGIAIDVNLSGLSAVDQGTVQSCAAAADLISRGCEFETSITNDQYRLSVRGCFTPDDTELAECRLPKALAERFREDAEIRCGCGCAEDCPTSIAALVCDEDGNSCQAGPTALSDSFEVSADVQTDHGINQETTVSSSTTYCGTCCDAGVDPGVASTSTGTYREIRFDLRFPPGDGCDFPECIAEDEDIDGPVSFRNAAAPDTVHVCLSSKGGFANPTDLLDCTAETGGDDQFTISNVAALDARLKTVTPAPVLVNDEND